MGKTLHTEGSKTHTFHTSSYKRLKIEMLASFFPSHYKILYIVPIVFILTIIYANSFEIQNLQTEDELGKHRILLTVTATFTYKRELRWIWLFLALFTTVIYCGVAPRMFKQYFLMDSSYLASLKIQSSLTRPPSKLITLLMYSCVGWTLCLCGVVFLIDGTFPAKTATFPEYIWSIHFLMLFGMLASLAVNITAFFKLLHLTEPDFYQNRHSIFRKYCLAAGHILSAVNMVACAGVVKMGGFWSWDIVCVFEYLVVLFEILFVIDQWSGMVGSDALTVNWRETHELERLEGEFRSVSTSNASSNVVLVKSEVQRKKRPVLSVNSSSTNVHVLKNALGKSLSSAAVPIKNKV